MSSSSAPSSSGSVTPYGPLGVLPGMTFDPVRNRYFPTPKETTMAPPPLQGGNALREPLLMRTGCYGGRDVKRPRVDTAGPSSGEGRGYGYGRLPKAGRTALRSRQASDAVMTEIEGQQIANLRHDTTFNCGGCHGENITSIRSFVKGAFYATTDHGKVIIHRTDGETHGIMICGAALFGLHCDIPRMTMMAISGGPEAHVHHFRRNPDQLNQTFMEHSEIDLPLGDIYSMSSYDQACSIGGAKSITTIKYVNGLETSRRHVPSDPLTLHQWDNNLVYAGLRNGSVILEDLRVDSRHVNHVGGTRKGKAVVGVKRLKDSAVPWGLLVSGMGDELMIYDVRYPVIPLRDLKGHINTYHTNLGLTTSQDDKFAIVAGSDNRLRLFSTISGQRVIPEDPHPPVELRGKIGPNEENPFRRVFKGKIEGLDLREDNLGLDVSVKGELYRFTRGE